MSGDKNWYYMTYHDEIPFLRGPYTTDQIEKYLDDGLIQDGTQVRYGPKSYWRPFSETANIRQLLYNQGRGVSARSSRKSWPFIILILVVAVIVFVLANCSP